jgi:murein DD-endopeptidase MepM/ murein hydrolase activator NlpD
VKALRWLHSIGSSIELGRLSFIAGVTAGLVMLVLAGWFSPSLRHADSLQVVETADLGLPGLALDAPMAFRSLGQVGPPAPDLEIAEGTIEPGHSIASSLEALGVQPGVVHTIAHELSPLFDFRYSRAGDAFRLTQDAEGRILEFRYQQSPLESYHLARQGAHFVAQRWEAERQTSTARIASVITSSLYASIQQLGEDPRLANDFANIFAWDIDFSHAVQPGDEFSILYERNFRVPPEGKRVYEGPGRILAARYHGGGGDVQAVYFELEEGQGGYYRPDGSSVQRQFLRAPLDYRRISSSYSLSRLHPILKVRRPHQGIDYAAAPGTPVWSVGSGKVIFRGRLGGFGNLVKIRHGNGFESWYGHLSGFARNLSVGARVSQKQVIGYVGSTGLATGPHLDFRMKQDGRYVNPARITTPSAAPIPDDAHPRFASACDRILAELDPQPLAAINEAL